MRLVDRIRSVDGSLAEFTVFAVLAVVTLILRLPYFFPAVLDWDESTAIIIGQGILDGFLPYIELWEAKPPLVFFFFAGAIAIVGKTIASVRTAGYLWLTIAAFLTYRSAYKVTGERRVSLASAVLMIVVVSVLGRWVNSEILSLVPLAGLLLLLISGPESTLAWFCTGLLMGTAALFRFDLVYTAVFVGAYVVAVIWFVSRSWKKSVIGGLLYSIGGFAIVLLSAVPYLLLGYLQSWFTSVFVAPYVFSASHVAAHRLGDLTEQLIVTLVPHSRRFDVSDFIPCLLLWCGGLVGVAIFCFRWREFPKAKRLQCLATLVLLVGAITSVLLTGIPSRKYWIQSFPFLAVFVAFAIGYIPSGRLRMLATISGLLILLTAIGHRWVLAYSTTFHNLERAHGFQYGAEWELAKYLKRENPTGEPIYLMSDHIVYWFIGQYPLTRLSTHPSNIAKPEFVETIEGSSATPESEMTKILLKRPLFIVKTAQLMYLDETASMDKLFRNALAEEYFLAAEIEGREIYRRKSVACDASPNC
jgi:4-amino-4-deoxy-L-arabinose transferase-like glycosyltransferase